MKRVHHPDIVQRQDGRWEVTCRDCTGRDEPVPVGIGLPVADPEVAAQIRDNHRGLFIQDERRSPLSLLGSSEVARLKERRQGAFPSR